MGMRKYSLVASEESIVLKVDGLAIIVNEIDNSVLIKDVGGSEGNGVPSLRITSKRAEAGGGVPPHVGYSSGQVDDSTEYIVTVFDSDTGQACGNRVFLGGSGYWYQHGNCESQFKKKRE